MRRIVRRYSSTPFNIPTIDASILISNHPSKHEECRKAVDILHKTGIMILKDPRVDEQENEDFLDMMERYYESRGKIYYSGGKLEESNPEAGYQTGVLEELQERARNHESTINKYYPHTRPVTPQPPPKDKKWRYMWRVGGKAEVSNNRILPDNKIPHDFPGWEERMDRFGSILMESCYTASEIVAVGLGVPQSTFRSRMEGGTQLLGPTGSDLDKYNRVGDVLAGFHYDISFLTIHGKSRFPGLFIWLRNGEKIAVKVPKGCFLLQAAKQLEIMTAGYIYAGYHEVVVTEETLRAAEEARKEGRSRWRVSSTMFSAIRYDEILKPLDIYKDSVVSYNHQADYNKYPPILSSLQVEEELKAIELLH